MACLPRTTRPGSSFSTRALNSLATCRGTVSASVTTWIARSAPIASAVRSCSCAAVGPTVTATISDTTFFSFRRTASSTAARAWQQDAQLQESFKCLTHPAGRTDLVKRVHAHLDVGRLDARLVRLDADLHRVVNHPLHAHKAAHGTARRGPHHHGRRVGSRLERRLDSGHPQTLGGDSNRRHRGVRPLRVPQLLRVSSLTSFTAPPHLLSSSPGRLLPGAGGRELR